MRDIGVDIKIIDRTEEEKNKDFKQAFADGLNMSIKDLDMAVKEILKIRQREKEAEKQGILLEQCCSTDAGKVLLGGSWEKLINYGVKNDKKQSIINMG